MILAGDKFNLTGLNFTVGSEVNLFIATSAGVINGGPLIPIARTLPTQLTVNVPATVPLGKGFVEVQVVNTDKGFLASNSVPALLQGSPAAGIPSITSINAVGLAATSSDPSYATNNVETVVVQGKIVTLGGMGFQTGTNGAAVDLFCACPGGKVGPFFLSPTSSTSISFTLPATGPNAPATGPGSFVVSNKGAGSYSQKSNAVSVPIGATVSVTFGDADGNHDHGQRKRVLDPDGDQPVQPAGRRSGSQSGRVGRQGQGEDPADDSQLEPVYLHRTRGSGAGRILCAGGQSAIRSLHQFR